MIRLSCEQQNKQDESSFTPYVQEIWRWLTHGYDGPPWSQGFSIFDLSSPLCAASIGYLIVPGGCQSSGQDTYISASGKEKSLWREAGEKATTLLFKPLLASYIHHFNSSGKN
jgi:hypothetical protein